MFTRMIMPQTDAATLSFLRYGIVGIILFFFCARSVLSISPSRNDLIGIMFIGLGMFAIFPYFMAYGLSYTTASRAGLLYATMPLATITIASLFRVEQANLMKVFSVFLAMIGIAVAMSTKLTPDNLILLKGDLMVMVGVLGAAVFTVFSGKYMEKYGNLPVMVFSAVSGVSVTFILSLFFGEPFNGSLSFDGFGWFAIFMLAVPGGALMMYSWGSALLIITPTQAAIALGFNPLTAMFLGFLLIGEEITIRFLAGFIMVVSAVVLSNISFSFLKVQNLK